MDSQQGQTSALLKDRANAIELLALAVGVAFGVNIATSAIFEHLQPSLSASLWIGVGSTAGFVGILAFRTIQKAGKRLIVEGCLTVSRDEKTVLGAFGYDFSETMERLLGAAFRENPAFRRIWSSDGFCEFKDNGSGAIENMSSSAKLVRELTEYYFLKSLSLHLSSHFINNGKVDEARLQTFKRSDIPSVLLQNRFLDLFSRPMEDREGFDQGNDRIESNGIVVLAYGKDGLYYDRFELILPRGTKVTRSSDGGIVIDTRRFVLDVAVVFDGFGSVPPRGFYELYLKKSFEDVFSYKVYLNVRVRFKYTAIFGPSGWEYFRWIDSFLDSIERKMSFRGFINSMGWFTAHTVYKALSPGKTGTRGKGSKQSATAKSEAKSE